MAFPFTRDLLLSKTVNNRTSLSSPESSPGKLGPRPFFQSRQISAQDVMTPTPCVMEMCCFATALAGCEPPTASLCGWKTLRRFFEQRAKSMSNAGPVCSPPANYTHLPRSVCRLHQVSRRGRGGEGDRGGGRTCSVAMESVSLHQLLSVTSEPRVTKR